MKSNFSTFCQLIWHTKGGFRVNLTSCDSFSSWSRKCLEFSISFPLPPIIQSVILLILVITFQRSIRAHSKNCSHDLASEYMIIMMMVRELTKTATTITDRKRWDLCISITWNCTLSDIFAISSTCWWRSALSQVVNTRDPRFCITFRLPVRVVKPVSYRFFWTESTWRSSQLSFPYDCGHNCRYVINILFSLSWFRPWMGQLYSHISMVVIG